MVEKIKTIKKAFNKIALFFIIAMLSCLLIFRTGNLLNDFKEICNSFSLISKDMIALSITIVFVISEILWIIFAKKKGANLKGLMYLLLFYLMTITGYLLKDNLDLYKNDVVIVHGGKVFFVSYVLLIVALFVNGLLSFVTSFILKEKEVEYERVCTVVKIICYLLVIIAALMYLALRVTDLFEDLVDIFVYMYKFIFVGEFGIVQIAALVGGIIVIALCALWTKKDIENKRVPDGALGVLVAGVCLVAGFGYSHMMAGYLKSTDTVVNGMFLYVCYWLTLFVLLANIIIESIYCISLKPITKYSLVSETKEVIKEETLKEEIETEEVVEEVTLEEETETEEVIEKETLKEETETEEIVEIEPEEEEVETEEVIEKETLKEETETEEIVEIEPEEEEVETEEVIEEETESDEEKFNEEIVVIEPEDELTKENFYEPFEEGKDGEVEDLIILEEKIEEMKFSYKKDLTIRLKMASSITKKYYSALVNRLSKYQNVVVKNDKGGTKFIYDKKLVAYVGVFAKFVKLYLALEPDKYPVSVYHHKDVSTKKKYVNAPFLLKVGSTRSFKYAEKLCTDFAKKLKLIVNNDYEHFDHIEPHQTTSKELMEIQNLGFMLRESATLEEAQALPKRGANGALILENKELSKKKKLKVEVSIEQLLANFNSGDLIDMKSLKSKKIIPNNVNWIKIIPSSECNKSLIVKANDFDLDALKLILITGGTAIKIAKI